MRACVRACVSVYDHKCVRACVCACVRADALTVFLCSLCSVVDVRDSSAQSLSFIQSIDLTV